MSATSAPAPALACPADLLTLAGELADASGAVIRRYFRKPVAVDDKADESPVTVADREAEQAIRAILEDRRPQDGIVGEEFGNVRTDAEIVWVIDPIDGTKSFITGKPVFGTLIAAVRDGVPILGIIDQPVGGERWMGATGHGATLNGEPIAVRTCPRLSDAIHCTTSPFFFADDEIGRYRRIEETAKHTIFGGDCYNYGMIAAGFVDIVVESGLQTYDFCALVPIVEEAGGIITDWSGKPVRLDSGRTILAAGDARVHAEALALLSG